MLTRILLTALAAGLLAGVFVSLAQSARLVPLIHHAESFEAAAPNGQAGHDGHDGHDHGAAWAPAEGGERIGFTVLANVLTGVGFALLLSAAFALSGRAVDWRRGLLWGLAGFAVFALAPALGLPPDPPGVDAGPVLPRQLWWVGTAAATALGLGLLVFARPGVLKAAGVAALALPHAIGAPHVDVSGGATPEAVIDQFILASLATSGLFWLVLGGSAGWLYHRLGRAAAT